MADEIRTALAGLLAGSFSMVAGEFVSVSSQREMSPASTTRQGGVRAASRLPDHHPLRRRRRYDRRTPARRNR
ncbi:MAG: VIT1/CCC1 transporter family protein [Kribbellaceae bacterium]